MKETSFINKSECTRIANNFRKWAKLGGYDGYEDVSLTEKQCINIAEQFENAREKGGEYFSNIIFDPFFTAREIETILTAI